jgi:hypothetical protein
MGIWIPGGHQPAEQVSLTPKQSNIFCYGWRPECRFRIAVCGRRFGKTFLAAREMHRAAKIAMAREISPDEEIWYGAPTFKAGKRVFWPRLKRIIPRHWIDTRREDECMIRLKTGHTLRIVGLDNYDDLRGSGLFFFIGDEWKDAQPECWNEVIQPMLATSEGHALKIGTPGGYDHFYDDYMRGQPGARDSEGDLITDTKSWKYSTAEGGNVKPAEIERARRDKDPLTFRQEFFADFVTFTGRVVYAFDRTKHIKPCQIIPVNSTIHIGMDFNINPMSATVWYESEGISYQFDEIILKTSDTDKMAEEIAKRYGRMIGAATKPKLDHITIYPDPAGAQRRTSAQGRTDISILKDHGLRVVALSSHPLVRDRINTTNARFENAAGDIRAYVDPKCVESIRAYERLTYKEDTNEPDKGSGFDHPVDATGYYFFTRFGGNAARQIKILGL